MKKIIFLMGLIFILTACAKNQSIQTGRGNQTEKNGPAADSAVLKGDIGGDTCAAFSADFVYSATGKPVVKVEPDSMQPKAACRYYFTYDPDFYKEVDNPKLRAGGAHIFVMQENSNVADQKKGVEFLGATTRTESRIKMENLITVRENGSIWDIKLIINPNRYVRMDYSNQAVTDEELINFAVKMAELILGQSSFAIIKNPAEPIADIENNLTAADSENSQAGASQVAVAQNFFTILAEKKIDQALGELDMNETTKAMWQTNFKTIESLKVKSVEPVFLEEWTAETQKFKAVLEASVTPAGESYGWVNGDNNRWLTLKLKSGRWLVAQIASNP